METTRQLVFSIGYQKMSVQTLTNAIGVAKGTFYHYFKSKEDLLGQWVIYEGEKTLPHQIAIANDGSLNALSKLNKIFAFGRGWKLDHLDMIISAAKVMYDDKNAALRQLMMKHSSKMMDKIISSVIIQGVEEGVFDTPFPKKISGFLPLLLQPYTEKLNELLFTQQPTTMDVTDEAMQVIEIMHDSLERVLGAPKGSIVIADKAFVAKFIQRIALQQESSEVHIAKSVLNQNI